MSKVFKSSKSLLIAFAALATVFLSGGNSQAISNVFPDSSNGYNDYAAVATSGGGWYLDSRYANFKVYIHKDYLNTTTQVLLQNICNWGLSTGSGKTIYTWMYANKLDTTYVPTGREEVDWGKQVDFHACNTGQGSIAYTNLQNKAKWLSEMPGLEDYYSYTLRVDLRAGYGVQGFRVIVNPNGPRYVTFKEDRQPNTSQHLGEGNFSIIDGDNFTGAWSEGSFNFDFAPDCTLSGSQSAYLKWYDADYRRGNDAGGAIHFVLIDLNTGGLVSINVLGYGWMSTVTGAAIGPEQFARRTGQFTVQEGHKYRWSWRNVDDNNGVQLTLPFSEFNAASPIVCNPPAEWEYVPQPVFQVITPNISPISIGSDITFVGNAVNTGTGAGTAFDIQVYPISSDESFVSAESFSAGGAWTGATGKNAQWAEAALNPSTATPTFRSAVYKVLSVPPDDEVCFRVRVRPFMGTNNGTATATSSGWQSSSSICYEIGGVAYPYLETHGADVWSGGAFANEPNYHSTSACQPPGVTLTGINSSIYTTAPISNVGSFGDFGVFATGSITGFGSSGRADRSGLTFANAGSLGYFSGIGKCLPNFYEMFVNEPATDDNIQAGQDITSLVNLDGQRKVEGLTGQPIDAIINAETIDRNNQNVVLVNGDVEIRGDITYDSAARNNRSQIPYFMLIVLGDINIQPSVNRLDGVYVAIPKVDANGVILSGGNINTCETSGDITTGSPCDSQLTINGSFVAQHVDFNRGHGDLNTPSDGPAEQFIFSNENYLSIPDFSSRYFGNFNVDQYVDLPPVY